MNDDADMYDQIKAIPADNDNMVNSVMMIVRNLTSEVSSPPRVTELTSEYGLASHTTSRQMMRLGSHGTSTEHT